MIKVKENHDVLSSLQLAMNSAAECLNGPKTVTDYTYYYEDKAEGAKTSGPRLHLSSLLDQVDKQGKVEATRGHERQQLNVIGTEEPKHVACPHSTDGTMCAGNQCCPRAPETGGKTYPCPSATLLSFKENGCEAPDVGEGEGEGNGEGPPIGEKPTEIGEGEGEGEGPTMPDAKKVHCATTDSAKAEVGGVVGAVSPPRNLANGEIAQTQCVKVNKEYFGVIWLTCNEAGLEASTAQCLKAANATKCQEELETLQKVYIKTYVDLARLIQSYEEKTTDGYNAAKEAIEDQCRDQREPLQTDAAKLASEASEKIKQLEELRPKLEDANDAYRKLAEQVKKLTGRCEALPETVTDLDKVRDAIKALSLCPGLNKARLIVPKWVGTYADFDVSPQKLSDVEYDALMMETCTKSFGEN